MCGARLLLLCLAALALTSTPAQGKTVDMGANGITSSPILPSPVTSLLTQLLRGADSQNGTPLSLVVKVLSREGEPFAKQVKSLLKKQLPSLKEVAGGLGVSPDFLQDLLKLAKKVSRMGETMPSSERLGAQSVLETLMDYVGGDDEELAEGVGEEGETSDSQGTEDIQDQLLVLARGMLKQRFGNLSSIKASATATQAATAGLWEVVRSTWARVLSYVEEQNSLESFLQRTPVKVIDRVLSLGDDLNLASFLAKKLDPEFAQFLAGKAEPLLGPLRHADSIANLVQAAGLGGALEYLTSHRVKHTLYTLTGLLSAHLENRVNSDLARQFLEFMSVDNVELTHFYRSLVSGGQQSGPGRARRNVLDHLVSTFEYDYELEEDRVADRSLRPDDQLALEDDQTAHVHDLRELAPRDGGYGGGYGGGHGGGYGYGYMSMLDPYVVLGALALGTLLGFLLFRLINGTARGRRDIGDGSLSLWQSDLPFPGTSRALRAERAAPDGSRQGLAVPPALRGDVWSSAPLVDDGTTTGLSLEEDDLADHLNQLWRAHRGNASTTCVRRRLCGQLVGPGATHAGLALLLSSAGSVLGVAGSGQLLDGVAGTQAQGTAYPCPAAACALPL